MIRKFYDGWDGGSYGGNSTPVEEEFDIILGNYESVSIKVDDDHSEDHYHKGCVLQAMKDAYNLAPKFKYNLPESKEEKIKPIPKLMKRDGDSYVPMRKVNLPHPPFESKEENLGQTQYCDWCEIETYQIAEATGARCQRCFKQNPFFNTSVKEFADYIKDLIERHEMKSTDDIKKYFDKKKTDIRNYFDQLKSNENNKIK